MASFRRIVGAQADVKELEYIAALHQTCLPDTRANGTVSSLDIQALLASRYGLKLSHEECIDIVRGLGGGISENDLNLSSTATRTRQRLVRVFRERKKPVEGEEFESPSRRQKMAGHQSATTDLDFFEEHFDLVQILSLLLIPVLKRTVLEGATTIEPITSAASEQVTYTEDELRNFRTPFLGLCLYYRLKAWHRMGVEKQRRLEQESLRPHPSNIIDCVLDITLREIQSSGESERGEGVQYPAINESLVRGILLECGEIERSKDDKLIAEMVDVARSQSGKLDKEAFPRALTADLDRWKVGSEDESSELYTDVFEETRSDTFKSNYERSRVAGSSRDPEMNGLDQGRFTEGNTLGHSSIDFVVDAHFSVVCVTFIWFFYLLVTVTYATLFQTAVKPSCKTDEDEFRCLLAAQLYNWFVVALFLCVFGVLAVAPMSLGNDAYVRTPVRILLASFVAFMYAVAPFAFVLFFAEQAEEPYSNAEVLMKNQLFIRILYLAAATGLVLTAFYMLDVVLLFVGVRRDQSSFFPSSNSRGEARIKKAATRKINKLLINADALHYDETERDDVRHSTSLNVPKQSRVSCAMLNYAIRGQDSEEVGGFLWTWTMLLNGKLFNTEGIWLPTRLIVFQVIQILMAILLSFIFLKITERAVSEAARAQENLDPSLPRWARQIIPTDRDVSVALYTASGTAIGVMLTLILIYIPSATSRLLRYRSGQIPSLGSPYFTRYRTAVDSTYMNMANAVYGLIGSAGLFYVAVGLTIFLFLWEFSKKVMIRFLAWGIGLSATIVLKMILTYTLRRNFYRSFYRLHPGSANLSSLALETWYLGLGSGVLIGRITQFLFAAVFWVGRIDSEFLSDDVVLFGYAFDYVPSNFVKDLLVHEAHRHPYMERLSQIYLMRFRYKKQFVTEACAVWRQIFVQMLFPWMRPHRVLAEERMQQALDALALNRLRVMEDEKDMVIRLGEDLQRATDAIGISNLVWRRGDEDATTRNEAVVTSLMDDKDDTRPMDGMKWSSPSEIDVAIPCGDPWSDFLHMSES